MSNRIVALMLALAAAALALPDIACAAAFNPDVATDAYLKAIDGAARARAAAYSDGAHALDLAGVAISILVALLMLVMGASRGLRDVAEGLTGSRNLQIAICAALFAILVLVATLPFEHYRGFVRENEFGRLNQTAEAWLLDYAARSAVSAGLFTLFATIVYALIRRARKIWWIWGAGVATLFAAFLILAGPFLIAPLFNTYEAMEAGSLKTEIRQLAQNSGIPENQVYRFKGSEESRRLSAHVDVDVLFGGGRISLSNKLLNSGTGAEIRNSIGHEIGRQALHQANDFLVMFGLISGVILAIVSAMFRDFVRSDGAALGLRDEADPASIPILFALATLMSALAMPAFNAISRAQEVQADVFGLNAAREPDGLATMVLQLSEYRKLDPPAWEQAIFSPYTDARSRILRAMRWKASRFKEFPVPGFEIEVGCSTREYRMPMAEVRWYSAGTDMRDVHVYVGATNGWLERRQFLQIDFKDGAVPGRSALLTDSPKSALEFRATDFEVDVDRRSVFDGIKPRVSALRVKNLEPGVLYFWRVARAGGAWSNEVRTPVGSCPADVEEEP